MNELAALHNEIEILTADQVYIVRKVPSAEDAVFWDSLGFCDTSRRLLMQTSDFRTSPTTDKHVGSESSCTYIRSFLICLPLC